MKNLKISCGGGLTPFSLKNTLLFKLIEKLDNRKLEFTSQKKADVIFYGPYYNFFEKFSNKILKKSLISKNFIPNIFNYYFQSKNQKKIFFSQENSLKFNNIKADFYFTPLLGVTDDNHFRIPYWKNCTNWPEYEIYFENIYGSHAHRYGEYYNVDEMLKEQGKEFIKKNKKFCVFFSHMMHPRDSIFKIFNKYFIIDTYGSYFSKNIKNHNSSYFKKKDVLKKYSFNLCPHTWSSPGVYSSDIPDAFLAKCLPITWADNNIENEFNKDSFINLINYQYNNYQEVIDLLKDDIFLDKFTKEPLLRYRPNLEKEVKFVSNMLKFI
jgi:hypothetical protein